ncbi:MAG: bifunctional riboflavin kinase/FAD synthetase [Flavobacteriales bacterium]|nr:bifunctional riboflavin kinase/FAD synthetase [Flavobacteriales bacterium]
MKVYHSISEFQKVKAAVVTTGTFDGVHLGHRKIIDRLNEVAQKVDGESVLLTFHPHPRMVLFPDDHGLELITTMNEKIQLLEDAGIQNLIIHPFTREFSRITSLDFIRDILVDKLGTSVLVIGYDHHFGRNREGSFEHLRESGPLYGFQVEEISVQDVDDVAVSSTKIRKALQDGDVATAEKYLSYPYQLSGTVIHGDKLGRELGFPTANIHINDPLKVVPANGVYACFVLVNGKKFKGMLNIGMRPTVEGTKRRIEVNIFNFDHDLYGLGLTLLLKDRIRDEIKFENVEQLKERLIIDRNLAEAML